MHPNQQSLEGKKTGFPGSQSLLLGLPSPGLSFLICKVGLGTVTGC